MKKIILIGLLMLVSCNEPNIEPASKIDYIQVENDFKAYVNSLYGEFKYFDNSESFRKHIEQSGSKYQELKNYQSEIDQVLYRFNDYLKLN